MSINYREERNIENSIPISLESLEIILEQMKKSICLIKCKKTGLGTGFFCVIPFPNKLNLLPVLFTNNHIIGKEDLAINQKIEIVLKNKQNLFIYIDDSRRTYTNKKLDITIIELKNDEIDILDINSFLEIDELVYKDKLNERYKNKQVYLLQYPNEQKINYSSGIIKGIDIKEDEIQHLCSSQDGSSGSPIMNLLTFKVIGIHKGYSSNKKCNLGTLIKNPIEEFYCNYMKKNEMFKIYKDLCIFGNLMKKRIKKEKKILKIF